MRFDANKSLIVKLMTSLGIERTIFVKSVTFLTSQADTSPLKLIAPKNASDVFVTEDVFHAEMSALNRTACINWKTHN